MKTIVLSFLLWLWFSILSLPHSVECLKDFQTLPPTIEQTKLEIYNLAINIQDNWGDDRENDNHPRGLVCQQQANQ